MDFAINTVTVASLLATATIALVACACGHLVFGKRQPTVEKWVLSWLVFDALIHFLLEGPFVMLSLTGTVNSSTSHLALLWKEYGKADARWLVSDPTVVSLEILTVVVDGFLCLVTILGIVTNGFYRHYAQLVLCVCELYGGWMTFCPEWLTGSRNLDTSNYMYFWVYLIFFNGLWVVIPLLLMCQTWLSMKATWLALASREKPKQAAAAKGRKDK